MPKVNGKKFAYSAAGKMKALKYAKKTGKKVSIGRISMGGKSPLMRSLSAGKKKKANGGNGKRVAGARAQAQAKRSARAAGARAKVRAMAARKKRG